MKQTRKKKQQRRKQECNKDSVYIRMYGEEKKKRIEVHGMGDKGSNTLEVRKKSLKKKSQKRYSERTSSRRPHTQHQNCWVEAQK